MPTNTRTNTPTFTPTRTNTPTRTPESTVLPTVIRRPTKTPELPNAGLGATGGGSQDHQFLVALMGLGLGILGLGYWRLRLSE
jgi:hypothetical protein